MTRDFMRPGRSLAIAEHGMAATSQPAATLAAVDILRAGGNAVDAALAAVAVQGVVDPHMTGVGGDCFALLAAEGRPTVALNGSGRAASGASLDWFLERGHTAIPDLSPHGVTVPGAVDAWCRLSADHGRLGLDAVLQPAIRAAEHGFVVTPRAALDWARYADRLSPEAAAVLLPGGRAPEAGARMQHPALAGTLRAIARAGRDAFYAGPVAEEIVAVLTARGGVHRLADFAAQRSEYGPAIEAEYRGHRLQECPPNGQGIVALMIARILEGFDMGPALGEADRIHLLAEATKAAYWQRDLIVADPAHHPFDVAEVLSDRFIDRLRAGIHADRASDPAAIDLPTHRDTVYVCVVDRDRNAVSLINSLFHAFGSGLYAPRAGVLLHNRGAGFRVEAGHRNAIAGGKRPLHTIIPGMLSDGARPVLAFGVMGGQYQAAGQVQLLSNMLDRGDDPQAASDRPRSFAFDGTLSLEPTTDPAVAAELARRGHVVRTADEPIGGYQGLWIDAARGVLLGGSDHRKDGMALGY